MRQQIQNSRIHLRENMQNNRAPLKRTWPEFDHCTLQAIRRSEEQLKSYFQEAIAVTAQEVGASL